ncbi:MAG: hypothetical protein IPN95_03665 [Bacteroidetes bacterium]|nr:hypothetical protein [Bacteroidota bacterium]
MRKFALTIAAILVMGSAFGQVWSYDWHGACRKVAYHDTKLAGDGLFYSARMDIIKVQSI